MEERGIGSVREEDFRLGRKSEEQWVRRRERKNTVEWVTEMIRLNL